MISRRTAAYFVDLLVFSAVSVLSVIVGELITGTFSQSLMIQIIITIPIWMVLLLISSGITGVLLRGSIGKKLMDLKVVSTMGIVTAFRLMFRDIAKYIAFTPLLLGVYMLFDNYIENFDFFITTLKVSGALLILVAGVQTYVGLKHKLMFADMVFFTKVENDIPTAVEYDDISTFLENKEKLKK